VPFGLRRYPAVDIRFAGDEMVYAILDDFGPTAIEDRGDVVRAFFVDAAIRDRALTALSTRYHVDAVDVPDEDWARRSQEGLEPVTVGRLTIVARRIDHRVAADEGRSERILVIQPSMGFGTGHHATTRLCLAALQEIDVAGRSLLDVGTGSGILAIAGALLGASCALGLDVDADAVHAAIENLALNPLARGVSFEVGDAGVRRLEPADIVTANLTGASLVRLAPTLLRAVGAGGALILSGILAHERNDVARAFEPGRVVQERREDEWAALTVKRP
jgi:ribosomal protein L11 methyltransferase